MQIIGGKLKGRKLASCKHSSIRPAMALVKKSIFDTLQDFVVGANVLDLYAGSGSLGIEAISRGAEKLTLIDSDKNSIKLIKKNLEICKINAIVICKELPNALNKKAIRNQKFNLIFIDPPYRAGTSIEETLKILVLNDIPAKDSLIFIESEAKCDFMIPMRLKLYKEKRYGNTKMTILCNA